MDFLTRRDLKYADLIVPLIGCPFGKAAKDCPFALYWQQYNFEERLNLINTISDSELKRLQKFHRNCILQRKTDTNSESQYNLFDFKE